ncbi:hypothetical protein RhiJN_22990 [Ceratobasidium sp. AG-Ba]|nr:hypothetical protein RhiJN_22990 [Ceratobasidium sp. AG-Ba]
MADERAHLLPSSSHGRRQRSLSTSSHWSQSLRWGLSQPPARSPQFRFPSRPDDILPADLTINTLEQHLPGLPTAAAPRAAVQIIWLLYLITEAASPTERVRYSSSRQEWIETTRVKRTRENLENLLLAVWRDFLNETRDSSGEETDEIEELLWYRVGLSGDSNGDVVRVVDMLTHDSVPIQFVCDPALQISLYRTWRHGLLPRLSPHDPALPRMLRHFDRCTTPRNDSSPVSGLTGPLAIIPPTFWASRPSFGSWPFVFIAISLLYSLPFSPAPDGSFRSLMVLSFLGLVVGLHSAYPPTPLLLFRPNTALPFAVYIRTIFTQTVTPTLAFFAPVLLALSVFLSLSVADPFVFPWVALTSSFAEHMGPSDPVSHPTPYTTRITIFSFYLLILISIPFYITSLVLLPTRHLSTSLETAVDWDTFGTLSGVRARRAFVHALIVYSQPEHYPVPLNIARLLWVTIPRVVLEVLGRPLASEWWAETVAIWVWRGWVGWIGLWFALIWLAGR